MAMAMAAAGSAGGRLLAAVLPLLLLLLLLDRVGPGLALSCYECNSHKDSKCADNEPPDSFKRNCSDNREGSKYILCRKIVQYIDFEVNENKPERRVIRSCGWDNSTYMNRCYQRSGFGGRQEVCACDTSYCNEAAGPRGAILGLALGLGLTLLLTRGPRLL